MSLGGLFGGSGYGAVDGGDNKKSVDPVAAMGFMSQIMGAAASPEGQQAQKALEFGRKEINEIVKYAEEGDWTWKLLGMFGGLAMMGVGGLTFMGDFFLFNYFGAILDVYIILFGLLTVVLEYKDSILPKSWVEQIKVEARFVYKPYGRAVLYMFFGVLLVSQEKFLYTCIGLYLIVIGGLVAYYAGQASAALESFKDKKLSSWQLEREYNRADKNKNGLSASELAKIVCSHGSSLGINEMESAIALLDKDGNGKISYKEFHDWYTKR